MTLAKHRVGLRGTDGFAKVSGMRFAVALALLCTFAQPIAAKEFKIYAGFTEDTKVELSDGAIWMMDKGDVFPVVAYKDQQKNIVLQLGGATFMTETARVRVLPKEEIEAGIEVYRKNLRSYLDSTSKKLQAQLQGPQAPKEKKPE